MNDGIYTHFGRHPLPETPQQPRRGRRLLFVWGAIAFGLTFAGMALGGLMKHRRRRVCGGEQDGK